MDKAQWRTERSSRSWTVRLVPKGRPAEGVCVVDCSAPRCTPPGDRYRDPRSARAAAMRHISAHVQHIRVPTGAVCRCRAGRCAWHRGPSGCGGPMVLVLVPGVADRVWTVAETCARCARAIPRGSVLKDTSAKYASAPSGPEHPGDWPRVQRLSQASSCLACAQEDAPQVHRSRKVRAWLADHPDRIELHFLPSYSPELNPDELVNADLKRSLPMHSRARDQAQLAAETRRFFHRRQRQPHIVRGYFGGRHVRYILE